MGFEKRSEDFEKVAMGAALMGGLRSFAQRVGNYFKRGVPKAVSNVQAGGPSLARSSSRLPYPGVESHKMTIPTRAKPKAPVRSNPLPGKTLDYRTMKPPKQTSYRTIDYSTFR